MKSNKFKLISAVLLVFFLGVAIGAMGTRIYVKHKFDRIKEKGLPPELVPRLMKKLSRELLLSLIVKSMKKALLNLPFVPEELPELQTAFYGEPEILHRSRGMEKSPKK